MNANSNKDVDNLIDSIAQFIDNENFEKIKILINYNNNINKKDIVLELYNKYLLTPKKLQFITEKCTKYINISSNLIKILLKNNNIKLLDIIFNFNKFFDNEYIKKLLFLYQKRISISTSDLNKQFEKYKIKISTDDCFLSDFDKPDSVIYLFSTCKNGNENLVKYLIKQGADINKKKKRGGETPFFYACKSGNENLVKYLIEQGADINKVNVVGETILFYACKSGNENIVKYLIECGENINEENDIGKTPISNACLSGNVNLVKYLIEHGADIEKESEIGETPLFN
eukprot:jgi/Orpsp1_1/1177377/evm.model.c7180000061226.1